MSAVLDKPTVQELEAKLHDVAMCTLASTQPGPFVYACDCEACCAKPVEVFGLTRVDLPDPEVLTRRSWRRAALVLDGPRCARAAGRRARRVDEGDFWRPSTARRSSSASRWMSALPTGAPRLVAAGRRGCRRVCDTIAAHYGRPGPDLAGLRKSDYAHCAHLRGARRTHRSHEALDAR
jgi:hypothetical protein